MESLIDYSAMYVLVFKIRIDSPTLIATCGRTNLDYVFSHSYADFGYHSSECLTLTLIQISWIEWLLSSFSGRFFLTFIG